MALHIKFATHLEKLKLLIKSIKYENNSTNPNGSFSAILWDSGHAVIIQSA